MQNMKDIGFPDYCITKDGKVWSLKVNRFLTPVYNKGCSASYYFVRIYNYEKKLVNMTIHRMVARVFIKNETPEINIQVNHKDGNKFNNDVSNLEWVSPSENNIHANKEGLRKPTFMTELNKVPEDGKVIHDWKEYGKTDLSDDDVHQICQMLEDGYRACDISRMTGFERRFVQYIRDNDKLKWKHIVNNYDFSKIKRKTTTSPETVIEVCELLQNGIGILEIARRLSVDRKLVGNIKARKFHNELSQAYTW